MRTSRWQLSFLRVGRGDPHTTQSSYKADPVTKTVVIPEECKYRDMMEKHTGDESWVLLTFNIQPAR